MPRQNHTPTHWRPPFVSDSRAEADFLRGDPFFDTEVMTSIGPVYSPSFDLIETPDKYTLTGDLPGLGLGDLDIELTAYTLTITGERDGENLESTQFCHALERTFGSFLRTFAFSHGVDGRNCRSKMENGVLTVEVPKRSNRPTHDNAPWTWQDRPTWAPPGQASNWPGQSC